MVRFTAEGRAVDSFHQLKRVIDRSTVILQSAAAAEETPAPPATASEPKLSAKGVRKVRQTERTLTCFLQALEGMRVVVELRQDTVIRGMLESADEEMNLVMTDATSTPLQGEKQELQWAYIKGHHIRYASHTCA